MVPLLLLAVAAVGAAAQAAAPAPAADGPTYYIAADEVAWNYAPSGVNLCYGEAFSGDSTLWTQLGVGSTYTKAQYRRYTDSSFSALAEVPQQDKHVGIYGPILRASVGQVLTIVLKNNLPFAINLEPAGVQPADGAAAVVQPDPTPVGQTAVAPSVAPGETVTYRFLVPTSMGPSELEPSAKMWLYRSTVDLVAHGNAGLVGPLLVSNTPEVNSGADPASSGQERDIITILQILDEGSSPFLAENLANRTALEMGVTEAGLAESNLKHAINGFLFCNAGDMVMKQGERVGSETDMHSLHLHGNTWLNNGHRADSLSMLPGTVRSLKFSTENAGFWLMHCHVGDHINAGMKAMYMVERDEALPLLAGVKDNSGTVRRYYIEAEEETWDYAPRGADYCSGAPVPWTPEQAVFTVANSLSLGSKFTKARYIEYTDDTFKTEKERSEQDEYQGNLGPVLRAEVGDTIEVVFKNSLRYPVTIHPHGVAYLKSSEGSPYFDGTMGDDLADDSVKPGTTYKYTWHVPESSGPGPQDPSTILWMYHSHNNEVADPYAGLTGAIVVGRKGELKEDLTAKDVDREIVLFFTVYNEVASLYANVNAQKMGFTDIDAWEAVAEENFNSKATSDQALALASEELEAAKAAAAPAAATTAATAAATTGAAAAPAPAAARAAAAGGRRLMARAVAEALAGRQLQSEEEEEEGYEESMLKHVINGYLYCNMPVMNFTQGQIVRFHVMALGTEVDLHTPNFVGQSLLVDRERRAAAGMMPGAMHSVDVVMSNPGLSLVQCRVADHISAGMRALINVTAAPELAAEQNKAAAEATVKRYFIRAELADWNYTPLGLDACTNSTFGPDAEVFVAKTNVTVGSVYKKAVYRQYTDARFTQRVAAPAFQGVLGPTLFAEVGQTLEVVFQNSLPFPANFMPDGGLELLPAGGEGGANGTIEAEAPVATGETVTLRYYVPASAGPGPGDLNTVAYTYTSSVDLVGHPNAGLIGVMVIGAPGALDSASGTPQGVDSIVPLLFTILDEGASPLLPDSMKAAGVGMAATFTPTWGESNLKHVVNGYLYCNLPGLEAPRGSNVRFVLIGMGSEADLHSPAFAGQVLRTKSTTYQTAELMPTVVQEVDVQLQAAGRWDVYCQVHDHYTAGMRATLVVTDA
ncbi:hypothetical protein COHA_002890 [Chlorella ohadii]|uniref:Multicopper ferroxidase n=1 Tax=Chlorella ohadii TaxID=2649997 RepID=A0AAD5H4L2_9CHLO|nr:hypothetical protein COHA_002890 [Chlorella ohadii]